MRVLVVGLRLPVAGHPGDGVGLFHVGEEFLTRLHKMGSLCEKTARVREMFVVVFFCLVRDEMNLFSYSLTCVLRIDFRWESN